MESVLVLLIFGPQKDEPGNKPLNKPEWSTLK